MKAIWTTPWTVVVIAALIIVVVLARGGFGTPQGQRAGLAVLGLLIVGFLWPPLGIVFGGVALFYLVFVHGAELLKQVSGGLTAGGNTQ